MAGVNEATLFRHFGNKDAIVEACAQTYCGTVELQELLGSLSGDLQADLERIGLALAERMEAVRDLILMSLVEEEQGRPLSDVAWRAPVAIRQIVGEYMARRVSAGELCGEPAALARFFMGMVFAHVIARKKLAGEYPLDHDSAVRFSVDVFLNGVRR